MLISPFISKYQTMRDMRRGLEKTQPTVEMFSFGSLLSHVAENPESSTSEFHVFLVSETILYREHVFSRAVSK